MEFIVGLWLVILAMTIFAVIVCGPFLDLDLAEKIKTCFSVAILTAMFLIAAWLMTGGK